MNVKEYALKFHQLSHYDPKLVSIMRDRMRNFSSNLSQDFVLEFKYNKPAIWSKKISEILSLLLRL